MKSTSVLNSNSDNTITGEQQTGMNNKSKVCIQFFIFTADLRTETERCSITWYNPRHPSDDNRNEFVV